MQNALSILLQVYTFLPTTRNRIKIGADSTSNYTKIGINTIDCTKHTKTGIVLSCIKIGANLIL
jgi:hypothetical protein